MTEKLVTAYTRYRVQKAKIKARQRQELDKELEPWAKDVGEAIIDAKSHGVKVDEIAILIGNKNRNFQYDMIRYAINNTLVENGIDPVTTHPIKEEPEFELEYHIRPFGTDQYTVETWRGMNESVETYVLTTYKNRIEDLPESWLTASPADRNVYSRIVQEIENG